MIRPAATVLRPAAGLAAVIVACAAVLAGCTGSPDASSTATVAPTTASPASTPPPSTAPSQPPALRPNGSAADNLPVFRFDVSEVWNSPDAASGRAYIDALVAAGFDKSAMQVTEDTTTIGDPAESIQFSVLWHDGECLVGQVGPATGAPVVAVLPAVGDGRCLIGDTRPIDW